jgi:hypothetical protein
MSALPTIQQLDCRPLTRPVFRTTDYDMRSMAAFGMANWDALTGWYVSLANEIRDTGEQMPDFVDFVGVQYDIERAMKNMTIETAADRKYAPEREPRVRSWEDRAANDAGSKCQGEI